MVVTAAAVIGSFAGTTLAKHIEPGKLRKTFAVFVLAMAGFMLYREVPRPTATAAPDAAADAPAAMAAKAPSA